MIEFYIDDIVSITPEGIILRNSSKKDFNISFNECVNNFLKVFPNGSGRCVATSDILKGYYTFYTDPKVLIRIKRKNGILSFLGKQKKIRQFVKLQEKIYQYGFTTFDLT